MATAEAAGAPIDRGPYGEWARKVSARYEDLVRVMIGAIDQGFHRGVYTVCLMRLSGAMRNAADLVQQNNAKQVIDSKMVTTAAKAVLPLLREGATREPTDEELSAAKSTRAAFDEAGKALSNQRKSLTEDEIQRFEAAIRELEKLDV